ncbi:hypothetical protein TIFTF001_027885 [Ficus carica]|uniref:Uncharacterized protein n=1 Tax=Ficus carica TaxID=3494 RepID=A0AA88J0D2_FICCA|nr:hypothetical protein TIFTF001_027885 [Ficus carica]
MASLLHVCVKSRRRLLVVNRNRVVDGSPSISDRNFEEWRLDQDFREKMIGS